MIGEAINELSFCLAGARIKTTASSDAVYFYNKKTITARRLTAVFVLQMDLETQTQTSPGPEFWEMRLIHLLGTNAERSAGKGFGSAIVSHTYRVEDRKGGGIGDIWR